MQVYLRIAKNHNLTLQKIENVVYSSQANVIIHLYPIPKWIKSSVCKCGGKAMFLIDGPAGFPVPICKECLDAKIPAIKLEAKEDTTFPLNERLIRKLKFEWSVNGDRWYYIHGRNLKPVNWKVFLKRIKKVVLGEGFITLEVDYKKETKTMRIY